MLAKLFVGSSKEAESAGLLDRLVAELRVINSAVSLVEIIPWPLSPWRNMEVAVRTLTESLSEYSYGVFVLSADDKLTLRGDEFYAARDNVIFEFGLFLACLGSERTFLVGPKDTKNVNLVSDPISPVLPLRILSDLGSAYRQGNYEVNRTGTGVDYAFNINDVITSIQSMESGLRGHSTVDQNKLFRQRVLEVKYKVAELNKPDSYYSGQFLSKFREISMLKAQITVKSVQNVVEDLLLSLENVPDFCDIMQLSREQHYSQNIDQVWVFAEEPLEFRTVGSGDESGKALQETIISNLENGVKYLYFVGPNFKRNDIDHLIDKNHPNRSAMLKNIEVIMVHSQFFSTYFTLHFSKGGGRGPKAIYMSSVMKDRNDLLIQVSDRIHIERIFNRISILRGELENNDSPQIKRYVLN